MIFYNIEMSFYDINIYKKLINFYHKYWEYNNK